MPHPHLCLCSIQSYFFPINYMLARTRVISARQHLTPRALQICLTALNRGLKSQFFQTTCFLRQLARSFQFFLTPCASATLRQDTVTVTVSPVLETKGKRCTRANLADVSGCCWEVGRHCPLCAGRLFPGPLRNWSPLLSRALLIPLFTCMCVYFPCDIGSDSNFPPREKLVVHDALRMNFQVFASGGAEAVTRESVLHFQSNCLLQ